VVEETGIVEELRENGLALVKAAGGESCASCKARGACHAFGGGTERRVTAVNQAGATVGDRVILSIGSGAFLKASILVYLVPVIALVIGSILGERYSGKIWPAENPEFVAAGVGLFCLVASFVVIRFANNRLSEDRRYYPMIERVIPLSDVSPPQETA
jgi:sigma-E factor negative regulatory protein RseC